MTTLSAWQRIDRVIPGKPFGNGADGAYSSATIPTLTKDSCSGAASSTSLVTAGSTFANGDVILIHQTRGTGVGQWEVNKVVSGGGSTSLTLSVALNYTYTDSGASQAQAVKINMYTDVTVQSGTWTIPAWDANVGGILPLASNGTTTITGTISGNAKGFVGGASTSSTSNGYQGEGTGGAGSLGTSTANGNGGGAGIKDGNTYGGGGGGGNGAAGSDSTTSSGGGVAGTADLTTIVLGGGGASGYTQDGGQSSGAGATGAGIVFIFAKNITVGGGVTLTGANGSNSTQGAGGAGAGGSFLIVCKTATLGSNLITALGGTGGTGGDGSRYGGNGAVGRIAVHHSSTVTGTTNPTFTDVSDNTMKERGGGILMAF